MNGKRCPLNNRSGFLIRAVSTFIDCVYSGCASALITLLVLPAFTYETVNFRNKTTFAGQDLLLILVCLAPEMLLIMMEVYAAASPGKLLLGLRVRSASGEAASLDQLAARAFYKRSAFILSLLVMCVPLSCLFGLFRLLGLLTAAFIGLAIFLGHLLALGPRRQTLHDRLAETAVYPVSALHDGCLADSQYHAAYAERTRLELARSRRALTELLF